MSQPMVNSISQYRMRRGVTLIEMLVVISILLMLMGIAVPLMQRGSEQRRIREATRAINVYLGSARNRAIETGRPCGVIFRRMPAQPLCSVLLEQAEVPMPYSGDTLDATATLELQPSTDPSFRLVAANMVGYSGGRNCDFRLISIGDQIQFNNQGPVYTIVGPPMAPGRVELDPTANVLQLQIDVQQGEILPLLEGVPSRPLPYKIFRRPVPSAVAPLQLPTGAAVDLTYSWVTDETTRKRHVAEDPSAPVIIVFSPNGALDTIYHLNQAIPAFGPTFLLVGKQEKVVSFDYLSQNPAMIGNPELDNLSDMDNLWISINPRSGMVASAEVAYVDPSVTGFSERFNAALEYAKEAQSMGGN